MNENIITGDCRLQAGLGTGRASLCGDRGDGDHRQDKEHHHDPPHHHCPHQDDEHPDGHNFNPPDHQVSLDWECGYTECSSLDGTGVTGVFRLRTF